MDNFSAFVMLGLSIPIIFLHIFVIIKLIYLKKLPESNYVPYDYITGQTSVVSNEYKVDKKEDDDQGDGKNKNL